MPREQSPIGRVCVYRSGDAWASIPTPVFLDAPETGYASGFCYSMALSGDGNTLVVGAPYYEAGSSNNVGCVYGLRAFDGKLVPADEADRPG